MESKLVEIWKDVVGYEGYYQISNLGRVKTIARHNAKERIKKPQNRCGYKAVRLFKCLIENKGVYFSIHRLLAIHFIPNPENKPQVNHINGDKADYRIENLEWCTASENTIHAVKTGLRKTAVGATYKRSNLTDQNIIEIRELKGKMTHKEIADIYGIGQPCISNIINRKAWKHVK